MGISQGKINKHSTSPLNAGKINNADAIGLGGSAKEQNLVKLSAKFNKQIIKEVKFIAYGSPNCIAVADYLASAVKGRDIYFSATIDRNYIEKYFGKFTKIEEYLLYSPLTALHNLISNYVSKIEKPIYSLEKNMVAVSMSGGIDSSVTAKIIKDSDYNPIGLTFKVLEDSSNLKDISHAKMVCSKLSIPHFTINLVSQFKQEIINKFYIEYLKGRTPNPCVDCNKLIKFGLLLEKAKLLGASFIASGHYCRKEKNNSSYILKKGIDSTKDQSYMLWRLTQSQLKHVFFPLGAYHKKDIKTIGKKAFPFLKDRPESQDVCFIKGKNYHELIKDENNIGKGKILNTKGEVIGTHKGYPFYTIGQRKGLGVSHTKPLYVKEIHPDKNVIIASEKEELYQKIVKVSQLNFIAGTPPSKKFKAVVKIRYNSEPAEAYIKACGNEGIIEFNHPQLSVTPGQSAVFYHSDTLLGGGIIIK